MNVKEIQTRLKVHGFYLTGKVDGDYGPLTTAAVIAFKQSKGLLARDYVGPITLAVLRQSPSELVIPPVVTAEPVWLRRARLELGVKEIKGSQHSVRVLSYWELAKLWFKDDETPWCAGFVCAMLEDSGIRSTRSGMAKSFANSQYFKKLDKFVVGCIVVFWRISPTNGSGHVTFGVSQDAQGNIRGLGGNQSDAVTIASFDDDRLVGFYWPIAVPVPGVAEVGEAITGGFGGSEA